MITNIAFFEHPSHPTNLYPFSILHLPWEMRYGAFSIIEAWQRLTGAAVIGCFGRPLHCASFYARYPQYRSHQLGVSNILAISSILLPDRATFEQISYHSHVPTAFTAEGEIVAVCCSLQEWECITPSEWMNVENAARVQSWQQVALEKPRLLKFLWDMLDHQGNAIAEQYACFTDATIHRTDLLNAHVVAMNAESVAVGENSSIAPFVVLDAKNGPIIIGSNVTIMPHATIIGPCAIGDHSTVKAGAKIYGGTVIGQWCKIGGEVECSTFQNYSNKQHDGFVGHSFISEWVNIGADTNTSNLKNTYRPISVELPSGRIPTGRTFLGLLCGDHTKAGINTMFSTGTVVGVCANIFGSGYTPPFIPSFTWGAITENKRYPLPTALDTARRAMARRQCVLLPEEEALLQQEYATVST